MSVRAIVSICCSPPERVPPHLILTVTQYRKHLKDPLEGPGAFPFLSLPHLQILFHRQGRENNPILRNESYAHAGDLKGLLSSDVAPLEQDSAGAWGGKPDNAFQQGGFANSVSAENANDFALVDLDGHTEESVTDSIVRIDLVNLQ
jgi:hypothetical protein